MMLRKMLLKYLRNMQCESCTDTQLVITVTIQNTNSPSCFHQLFHAHVWTIMLILTEIISESASAQFFSERRIMTNLRLDP